MSETVIGLQQSLAVLGITSESLLPALDLLSCNRIAYHSLSTLSLRMRVPRDQVAVLLKPLENRIVAATDHLGERAYCFAPVSTELKGYVDTLLASYQTERDQLRESLSQQLEIQNLRDKLEFNQDLMHTILCNVGEILIIDLEGNVLATSGFVRERLGIERGASHAHLVRIFPFDPLDESIEKSDIVIDGTYLECRLSDFVSRGKRIGRNLSIKDVTEERKLQESREMYERSRKQLFSMIAHELQNPALGLQSFLQDTLDLIDRLLVSGKIPEFEPEILALKEDVYLNQRGQTLLNRVIGDIFDYVKLQRGQMQFTVEQDVSVDYLIALCSMQCHPLCARKGIALITPPDGCYSDLPVLVGDSTRLAQVLNNLIKNAVKFTPPHGEIRLEVSTKVAVPPGTNETESFVCISITDTGRGMTDKEMDMIFKEYRGSESDGMGLGLMIADLIIKAHGGHITIQSELGKGSSFQILLPVTRAAHMGSAPRRFLQNSLAGNLTEKG